MSNFIKENKMSKVINHKLEIFSSEKVCDEETFEVEQIRIKYRNSVFS